MNRLQELGMLTLIVAPRERRGSSRGMTINVPSLRQNVLQRLSMDLCYVDKCSNTRTDLYVVPCSCPSNRTSRGFVYQENDRLYYTRIRAIKTGTVHMEM
jgi:hypothetical protein